MTTRISVEGVDAACNAVVDKFDSVAGNWYIYDGDGDGVPTDADTAITDQTLLATGALPTPCFGASSAGQATKIGTWQDASANAGGDASDGFFRLVASDGTTIQGDIGAADEMTMDNYVIVATGIVTISTFTYTHPEA